MHRLTLLLLTLLMSSPGSGGDPPRAVGPVAQPDLAPIDVETVIASGRERLWTAWTTESGVRAWLATDCRVELRVGGPFEIYFRADAPAGERGSEGCTVLSFLPHEMLSFTWNAPPKFAHARGRHTWVVVEFQPAGENKTRVRLRHLGFAERAAEFPAQADEWRQVRGYFAEAWPRVLAASKEHAERAAAAR